MSPAKFLCAALLILAVFTGGAFIVYYEASNLFQQINAGAKYIYLEAGFIALPLLFLLLVLWGIRKIPPYFQPYHHYIGDKKKSLITSVLLPWLALCLIFSGLPSYYIAVYLMDKQGYYLCGTGKTDHTYRPRGSMSAPRLWFCKQEVPNS